MLYGIDPRQLRFDIVRPTLEFIGLHSECAENLVVGTALVESAGGRYLRQRGGGPALSPWQMEPATHDDIWRNYLRYNHELAQKVGQLETVAVLTEGALELIGNLYYAAAMCRVHYRRVREPLPTQTPYLLAKYWKDHYNTSQGRGSVEEARIHFAEALK